MTNDPCDVFSTVNIPVYYLLVLSTVVKLFINTNDCYLRHIDEHPSLSTILPSSHCYVPCLILSPQTVEQEPLINGNVHP